MSYNDDEDHDDYDTVIDGAADVIFYIGLFLAILWIGNYIGVS